MAIPRELVGAWRRSGLLLDGVRTVDYCDVIWLQTPEWFADIRLLIDRKAEVPSVGVPDFFYQQLAFAGVTTWEWPTITWNHLIDSNLEPAVDSNPITWADGVVLENGSARVGDRVVPFTEEWLRMTNDGVSWRAEPEQRRVRVEVGRFAIEMKDSRPTGSFQAVRYHRHAGVWVKFGEVTC
jgi:Protein HRI1